MAISAIITYCKSNGWVPYSGTYSDSTPFVLQDPTGEFLMTDPEITLNTIGNIVFSYVGTTPNYYVPKVMINIEWTAAQQSTTLTSFIDLCSQSNPSGSSYPLIGGI